MRRCPTAQDLEKWLDEELSDAGQSDVAEHVGVCAPCQATLERLTEKTCVLSGLPPQTQPVPSGYASVPAEDSTGFLSRLKQSPPSLSPCPY
jgi:hypothetical protein